MTDRLGQWGGQDIKIGESPDGGHYVGSAPARYNGTKTKVDSIQTTLVTIRNNVAAIKLKVGA